jgi:VWFA-related protein
LLFDGSTMTPREMAWAQGVASGFVDATLAPEHSMAVIGFGGALSVGQTFTIDAPRLKAAINGQHVAAYSAGDDGVASVSLVRDELRSLDDLLQNLDGVPGRKSLVYFTAGFPITSDNSERLDQAIDSANRSNVAIYPVNVRVVTTGTPGLTGIDESAGIGGLPGGRGGRGSVRIGQSIQMRGVPVPESAAGTSPAMLQGVMADLATGTGGFFVRQPDDTAALNRIGQEQKEYYLLGYTPPEGSQGSCHTLRVRVERKDTEWRARKEYCNLARGDVLSGNPVERELEARAADAESGSITATMQTPFFYTGPNVARLIVAMEIDASQVRFKKEKGVYRASFDILGVATRPDGATGARFSDTVKLELDEESQVDTFKAAPYLYRTQLDVAPGEYSFVVVFSSGGANFGRVETPLVIEPYQPDTFAISALALSTDFQTADAGAGTLDELLIDDSKKLLANSIEATPAGSAVIPMGVQTGFYGEIYEPLLTSDPENSTVVAVQMRLFVRGSTQPAFDSGPMRLDLAGVRGKVIPLMQRIPLEDMSAGLYTYEVQALDSAGNTARRTVDFELK